MNPATGQRQLTLMSESQEILIGKQTHPEVLTTYGAYDDAEWQVYIQQLGEKMAAVSERSNLDWTFTVLDDPVVNAMALPGGFIYINRGILAHFNSEAELASVLGHEIGHVTARHSVEQMSRAQLAQIGLGVAAIASEEFRQYAGLAGQGLVFADDPRQGYTIGHTYYHPVLAFKIDFPDQWRIINQRQAVGALSPTRDAALVLTLSDEASPRAAFDAFFAQQGIEKGPNRGHNTFAFRSYDTQTGVREAEGYVRFISHGGRVYQLLGYTGVDTWKTYGAAMQDSLASFSEVTDRRYLDVKPKTIDVVKLPQDMTFTEFAKRYPSTVKTSELAILNGVTEDAVLEKGLLVKRVVGGKLPQH